MAGFLGERHGFRAVFWLLFTFSSLIFILFYTTLPETYHPYLLKLKAERRRRETGDDRYWAKLEREDMSLRAIVSKVIARPMVMLFFEPIVSLISCVLLSEFRISLIRSQAVPRGGLRRHLPFLYSLPRCLPGYPRDERRTRLPPPPRHRVSSSLPPSFPLTSSQNRRHPRLLPDALLRRQVRHRFRRQREPTRPRRTVRPSLPLLDLSDPRAG